MRTTQIIFDSQPTTPFAGVTIADPTAGATDTVHIGILPLSPSLEDGAGYSGLTNRSFDAAASHVGSFYMLQATPSLQGTPSKVMAELDALVLTQAQGGGSPEIGVDFEVESGSGATSPVSKITIENLSAEPDGQGVHRGRTRRRHDLPRTFRPRLRSTSRRYGLHVQPRRRARRHPRLQVRRRGPRTLELSGADFGNSVADLLRHTHDVKGSAFITALVTGDVIRLAGVLTVELKAHPKDFAFV